MEKSRLISCDEGGFTGPNLLDPDQPVFTFAAIDLSPDEAKVIINNVRRQHTIQAPELKSTKLRKRGDWLDLALSIAEQAERRVIISVLHKQLNLCGKAYEYIFEPVLQANSALFYRFDLHRFVMNAVYRAISSGSSAQDQIAVELQAFMRSFDPTTAPSLFQQSRPAGEISHVVTSFLKFCVGYADIIAQSTEHLQTDAGRWTLDLSNAALFSLLFCGWGLRYDSIEVLCDESKPLRENAPFFDRFVDRKDAFALMGREGPSTVRANLIKPLVFGKSHEHPTLQIADVLAGAAADVFKNIDNPIYSRLSRWVFSHLDKNTILPDTSLIDTRKIGPRVNLEVMRELARRATNHLDPLLGMEQFYQTSFERFKSPASRLRQYKRHGPSQSYLA